MGDTFKHLEFIQNVIIRMNSNSFLIKGWTVTIVSALFALAAKDSDKNFIYVSLFPTLIFWFLDTYYLRQERLFRFLYDKVRVTKESDFSMNTNEFTSMKNAKFLNVFKSITLSLFYISILFIIILIIVYLNCWKGNCNASPTCFLEF